MGASDPSGKGGGGSMVGRASIAGQCSLLQKLESAITAYNTTVMAGI